MNTFPFGKSPKLLFDPTKGFGQKLSKNDDDGEEDDAGIVTELREFVDEGDTGEGNMVNILDENGNYTGKNIGQLKKEIIQFKFKLLPFFKTDATLQSADKLYQDYVITNVQYYNFLRDYNLKKLHVEAVVPASAAVTRQWQQNAAARQQQQDASAARQWQQPQQQFGQQFGQQQFGQPQFEQQRASPSTNQTRKSRPKKELINMTQEENVKRKQLI